MVVGPRAVVSLTRDPWLVICTTSYRDFSWLPMRAVPKLEVLQVRVQELWFDGRNVDGPR